MILFDTSIWIEFLKGSQGISGLAQFHLEQRNVFAFECVFGELLQGTKNKREKGIILGFWDNLPRINQQNIWIEAGEYAMANKTFSKGVGLIDVAILMAARKESAQVWTLDKKLKAILKTSDIFPA